MWCAVIGMFLAVPGMVPWRILVFGTLGISLLAGAGFTFNCLVERGIDARMARTRADAARLVTAGHVRVNGRKCDQPSKFLALGDVLTISLQRDVRVLRVCAFAARRGPYEEARRLYEDLAPLKPAPDPRGDAPA